MRRNRKTAVRTCGYCRLPYPVSDGVAEESPFCAACLQDRVAASARGISPVTVVDKGGYWLVTSVRPEMP
jgi:hypothetical protein